MAMHSWRVSGYVTRSTSVAPVSALIGLKDRLPHSLSQISLRMSVVTGAFEARLRQARRDRLDARWFRAIQLA
jgi:hypothetical protein